MSMRKHIRDVYKLFLNDEELLRLLYYPPANLREGTLEPLDESLTNILDMDEEILWEIRDSRILLTSKDNDLEEKPICRIYLYAGKRRPSRNYYVADQEVIVDILCHESYEKDQRSMWISDRINELLCQEHVTGFGEVEYAAGSPIGAPKTYIGYKHIYKFGSMKK